MNEWMLHTQWDGQNVHLDVGNVVGTFFVLPALSDTYIIDIGHINFWSQEFQHWLGVGGNGNEQCSRLANDLPMDVATNYLRTAVLCTLWICIPLCLPCLGIYLVSVPKRVQINFSNCTSLNIYYNNRPTKLQHLVAHTYMHTHIYFWYGVYVCVRWQE